MAMSVLTDTQREAVDYVLQHSEADSRKVFPRLLKRVKNLGYDEKDLEKYDTGYRFEYLMFMAAYITVYCNSMTLVLFG